MKQFKAPWGRRLRVISSLFTVVFLGLSAMYLKSAAPGASRWAATYPLLVIFGAMLFMVRGYTITGDSLLVQRLAWSTRLPLAGLQSAQYQPGLMRDSTRRFGNGGSFSYTGWFWHKSLGTFRVYVTDLDRTVVLTFPNRRIVVSPDNPEEFVRVLVSLHGCPP